MRNVIGSFKNSIICKYDLKGSSINRKTNFEPGKINSVVLKDLNFDEIEKSLLLSQIDTQKLRSICSADAYFLTDMGVMDYSLFVVKIYLPQNIINKIFEDSFNENRINTKKDEFLNSPVNYTSNLNSSDENMIRDLKHYSKYMFRSLSNDVVYIISIIDYLQLYNFYKFIETNYKYYIKSRPENIEEISCVKPEVYCERFISYINKITEPRFKL